jgi:tRNA nucleotidyltransferase (CCA-adding enzyme)
MRVFLVGGPVRDLLLERPALDIDVSVEGDAVMLAQAAAREAGAKVVKSSEFGTAAVKAGEFALDLAAARAEVYPRPGALPRVRPATIDADLLRRDFTINAIALELAGTSPGRLLDPVGGIQDTRAGAVRVLHDRSFQDDPTRIIRAVRYETRLDFWIEERTYDLLKRDCACLDTVSGTRIRQELARTFAEPDPAKALARMQKLGVLQAIHPALRFTAEQAVGLGELGPITPRTAPFAWAVLAWDANEGEAGDLARRLALTKAQREAVEAVPRLRALIPQLSRTLRPSETYHLLQQFPDATILALAAMPVPDAVRDRLRDYLETLSHVRTELSGDDVTALGIPRGPRLGEVLQRLQDAKLDGNVPTRADEERFVRALATKARRKGV